MHAFLKVSRDVGGGGGGGGGGGLIIETLSRSMAAQYQAYKQIVGRGYSTTGMYPRMRKVW